MKPHAAAHGLAPSTFTEGDDFDLTVYITSENEEIDRQEVDVSIKKATTVLTLDTAKIATQSDSSPTRAEPCVSQFRTPACWTHSVIVYLTPPTASNLSEPFRCRPVEKASLFSKT